MIEQTLVDLRLQQHEVDVMLRDESLLKVERRALELSSIALRDAERVLIKKIQGIIIKDEKEIMARLDERSRIISNKVTEINKGSKVLDTIEAVIKIIVKIASAFVKW